MRVRNEEEYQRKKNDIMEKCFDCYAEHGLGILVKDFVQDSSLDVEPVRRSP